MMARRTPLLERRAFCELRIAWRINRDATSLENRALANSTVEGREQELRPVIVKPGMARAMRDSPDRGPPRPPGRQGQRQGVEGATYYDFSTL